MPTTMTALKPDFIVQPAGKPHNTTNASKCAIVNMTTRRRDGRKEVWIGLFTVKSSFNHYIICI